MSNSTPMPNPTNNIPDDTPDNANELFDTFTASGEPLGVERRSVVHAQGIWHRAVNVMLFRTTGELVLQQRAASKRVCPLAWDLSVAEHLQPGESWSAAAARGLQEELGLTHVELTAYPHELQERHIDQANDIQNFEFQRCFRGVSDAQPTLDTTEVAATRAAHPTDFAQEVRDNPEQFTPWLLLWAETIGLIPPTEAT